MDPGLVIAEFIISEEASTTSLNEHSQKTTSDGNSLQLSR